MSALTHEQSLLLDTARRFLASETPMSAVRALADTTDGFERPWWQRAATLGFTALLVPDERSGAFLSDEPLVDLAGLAQEFGRAVAPGPLVPCNVVAAAVAESGSAHQQAELLQQLGDGRSVAAWCYKEPRASWSPDAVRLPAEPAGHGFVLNGVKTMVEAASEADIFLLTARAPDGLRQFLVPSGTAGVTVTPRTSVDLVRRYGDVRFSRVEVPGTAVLAPARDVRSAVARQQQIAVVLQCAEMVGAAERVLELTIEYGFDRHSFGRPLVSYQALKHKFADMKLWLEASRATTHAATRAVAADLPDAQKLASVAKAYVADRAPELVQGCVQMHGAIGVTWEHDLHLYLRRLVADRMTYGTPEEHRDRVGRLVLRDRSER